MNKGPLSKILICVISFSVALCAYLHTRNHVTKKMIHLPRLLHELALIQEQNTILRFEMEKFENPSYLLQLLQTKEYAHLFAGTKDEVIAIDVKKELEKKERQDVTGLSSKTLLGTSVR